MLDYFAKLTSAYNQVEAAASTAARAMDKTKVKNKQVFTNLIHHAISEDYPKVLKVVKALSELDFAAARAEERKKMLAEAEKQVKEFRQIKQSYLKNLDHALTAQIPLPDDNAYPTYLKVLAPVAYRCTKLLKTEIEAIAARAVANWEQYDKQAKSDEILRKGNEKTAKIQDDAERNFAKEVSNAKAALLTFAPKLKSAVAKGAAAVQKIKANPTPRTYNDEMNYAGRDLSQNINNIDKWRNRPDILSKFKEVRAMPDPGNIAARIAAFGNGTRRSVDATATAQQILAELKDYSAILKDVARVYGGVMTGELASKLDR